jgi:hypothetical protein
LNSERGNKLNVKIESSREIERGEDVERERRERGETDRERFVRERGIKMKEKEKKGRKGINEIEGEIQRT